MEANRCVCSLALPSLGVVFDAEADDSAMMLLSMCDWRVMLGDVVEVLNWLGSEAEVSASGSKTKSWRG